MKVVLTRPREQANDWAKALRQAGFEVIEKPLIDISPIDFELRLMLWSSAKAMMFVSSNAVRHFFESKTWISQAEYAQKAIENIANKNPSCIRFWATGQGTVSALLAQGIAAEQIDAPKGDAGFDSEALWLRVQHQIAAGDKVLIVRGRDRDLVDTSRRWLADQIHAAGGKTHQTVVYERRAPGFSAQDIEQIQELLASAVWLFSSSQAIANLPPALNPSKSTCLCTHERIAQKARQRGFANVHICLPTEPALLASLKSLA